LAVGKVSRRVQVAITVALAILPISGMAVSAAPASARIHPVVKRFGGVIPDRPTGVQPIPMARIANLPYGGGPVLHSNRTHLIFWQPAGSPFVYDAGYEAQFELFLSRVAADSRQLTNVYSLTGQYRDSSGPAAYDSTYGGAVVATDPLPANGCTEPAVTGPGWTACLDDAQLETEIAHVVVTDHLQATARDVYFLVLPDGIGTCQGAGPDNCALGGDAAGSFCGYHSSTPDGSILYAVVPYNAVAGHCQSGNPRPNASTADPSLSTLSHEHSEMITDPLGDAWIDASGNEDGDLCIAQFGPILGGSGAGAWNEVIDGGRYFLQEEWSNDDGRCRPRADPDWVAFSSSTRIVARKAATFTAHAGDPHGQIVAFDWSFGDGGTAHGHFVKYAFARQGSYRATLRVTDSAGNQASVTRTLRVGLRARPVTGRARHHLVSGRRP
jgi:hypothetical protein